MEHQTMTLPPPAHLFPDFPAEDQRHHHAGLSLAIARVLESGRYILGGEGEAFEAEFAAFVGTRHVVGVGTGTDAIELLLRALGIGPGHGVAVPALAPSACAAAVRRAGAEVVLVDVEEETLTLCPLALKSVLDSARGSAVKAVLAVHLYGHPVAWDELRAVCEQRGISLLEDAAQAHGALYRGRSIGALGQAAAWSFYPTKNLGALGDAGAVSTSDDELAARLKILREYGWKQRQISHSAGINSRLDELQAALLRVKLPELAHSVEQRGERAAWYRERLHGVQLPVIREGCRHAFHQFVVRSPHRDALARHLQHHGVPVAVHYPAALHQQPAFACEAAFPVAEKAVREVLSLPMHPYVTREAVEIVSTLIQEHTA